MRKIVLIGFCAFFGFIVLSAVWRGISTLSRGGSSDGVGEEHLVPVTSTGEEGDDAPFPVGPAVVEEPNVLFEKIAQWTPDCRWSALRAGTYGEVIIVDESRLIPANTIAGYVVTADGLSIEGYRNALPEKLARTGWILDLRFDADGPSGTHWGYRKPEGDGLRFLIFSATQSDCTSEGDSPERTCRKRTSQVFYTNPVLSAQVTAQ